MKYLNMLLSCLREKMPDQRTARLTFNGTCSVGRPPCTRVCEELNSYECMTIRSIKRGHCQFIVHYCNVATTRDCVVIPRTSALSFGRATNPQICTEGSEAAAERAMGLQDQEEGGKGSPRRFVTSLNFTSTLPRWLVRSRDIKQKILIGHVVQAPRGWNILAAATTRLRIPEESGAIF